MHCCLFSQRTLWTIPPQMIFITVLTFDRRPCNFKNNCLLTLVTCMLPSFLFLCWFPFLLWFLFNTFRGIGKWRFLISFIFIMKFLIPFCQRILRIVTFLLILGVVQFFFSYFYIYCFWIMRFNSFLIGKHQEIDKPLKCSFSSLKYFTYRNRLINLFTNLVIVS